MRFFFLPGIACDARLFEFQKRLPFRFDVPDWPEPRPDDSLEAYAGRMAESIGRADVLAGVSFGGMLAQAMAERVGARLVVGIATARRGTDIPHVLRFAEILSRSVPQLRTTQGRILVELGLFGHLTPRVKEILMGMLETASMDLIRASSRMVCAWKGSRVPCPVRLIHGERDLIIRPEPVAADRIVPGGGHMINLTHPRAVNEFLIGEVARLGGA